MKDLTIEEYYKSLTTAEWDMAEAIEKELEKVMVAGMTEETAIKFVRTTMAVRKAIPGLQCVVYSVLRLVPVCHGLRCGCALINPLESNQRRAIQIYRLGKTSCRVKGLSEAANVEVHAWQT